jgi:low affinity Fe/Cu permease
MFEVLACRLAEWFASPWAVIGIPLACIAWYASGLGVEMLTLVLSVVAITTTQLVLAAQRRGERAVKAEVDEIVRALPGADETILDKDA